MSTLHAESLTLSKFVGAGPRRVRGGVRAAVMDCRPRLAVVCTVLLSLGTGGVWAQSLGLLGHDIPAYLEFSSPTYTVGEDHTNAVITVNRTGEFRIPVWVGYSTRDGTARAGQDYTATSGQLLIPAGVGFASFVVPIQADGVSDGTETVLLTLSQPSPGAVITQTNAVLSIVDTVNAPDSPSLTIRPDGQGGIVISWPSTVGACVLEKSDTATGGTWVAVSGSPQLEGRVWQVTELVSAGQFFYRLRVFAF